jgi:hypothetical protein
MKGWITGSLIALLGASTGCGSDGDKVDLGDDKVAKTGEKLSDYAGDWKGYAEAFHFDDGTDAVAIKLDRQGNGVIEVGEADPLPPPTADEIYPPMAGTSKGHPDPFEVELVIQHLISGYSYPISGAKVESKRIQFQSSTAEVLRDWCELQTPVLDEANTEEEQFMCSPNLSTGFGPDGCSLGDMTVPCAKLACKNVCACTKSSCEPSGGDDVEFDAALESDGEELVGTLHADDRITVRLMRQ